VLSRPQSSERTRVALCALHNGAGTIRRLKRIFGERRIENLPIPHICVSANLGTTETIVHDAGKMVRGAVQKRRVQRELSADGTGRKPG
jgi:hypothetical protein